jgi:hypothetical protein
MFPSTAYCMSVIAFSVIFIGGIHELLSAVFEKIYFIYLVIKHRMQMDNKIKNCPNDEIKNIRQGTRKKVYLSQNKIVRQSLDEDTTKIEDNFSIKFNGLKS